jgi:hypothetical protein
MSELKVNKISPRSGTDVTLGDSGDTFTIPAGASMVNNGTASGFGLTWQSVKTADFTAVKGEAYPVNTTSDEITVTLPATPSAGDQVQLVDYAGTFDTNQLIIDPNGEDIEGQTDDLVLRGEREGVILTYIDSTQGWIATSGINEGTDALEPNTYSVDFLIAAGGGGGGSSGYGGGGAGGYLTGSTTFTLGEVITVTVGGGGAGGISSPPSSGTTGSNSLFTSSTTALGGGGGGGTPGKSGGSGGGGNTGGAGTSGQGNNGGNDFTSAGFGGGGGGGAGQAGVSGTGSNGGNGGNGLASSITGSSITYAGGGGGACELNTTQGLGGTGGGGNAGAAGGNNVGIAGTTNLGGGGGGGHYQSAYPAGGAGGSGVVILSVPTSKYSGTTTGSPTVGTDGTDTILTFTGSGSYTA